MRVIIYGVGPFAKLLHYYITNDSDYEVVAFCVDESYIKEDLFCGLPVYTFESIEGNCNPSKYKMLIAIGCSKIRNRKVMFEKAIAKNYTLINYIHSSVVSHGLVLGRNNIILAGCVIEPNVEVGDNNVIWSMSLLGHDCTIGNHNYISAKCLISGNSVVSNLCFIGNGAIMLNNIVINDETCVAAGSYLRKSTFNNGLYAGNPARLIRCNMNGIEIK